MGTLGVWGVGPVARACVLVAAKAGQHPLLVETDKERLERGAQKIRTAVDEWVKRGVVPAGEKESLIGKVQISIDPKALLRTETVIEATGEGPKRRIEVLRELDSLLPSSSLIATSGLGGSVTKFASGLVNEPRLVGLNFILSGSEIRLVEIVRGVKSSEESLKKIRELITRLSLPWVNTHDFSGLLFHRVTASFINEAAYALFEGIGTAEEIDRSFREGTGNSVGPLALADILGLDVVLSVLHEMSRTLAHPRYMPCPLLVKYVEAGYCGVETGRGFFDYRQDAKETESQKTIHAA